MTVRIKQFRAQENFIVKYRINKKISGYSVILEKYEKGKLIERAESMRYKTKEQAMALMGRLYKNNVTPMHLRYIMEDEI